MFYYQTYRIVYLIKKKVVRCSGFSSYKGELIEWVWIRFGWTLEIVKRNETGTFKVLPKRGIVERTFAWWLSLHRRMSKDYESLPEPGIAFIQ